MIQKIFSKKNVALAVLILAAGILYMTSGSSDGEEWQVIAVTETDARSEEETEEAGLPSETGGKDMPTAEEADSEPTGGMQMVFVHVAGAVNSPGVYQVEAGTRVYQVIDLAGGLTGDADREFLNMAQLVADGQKIDRTGNRAHVPCLYRLYSIFLPQPRLQNSNTHNISSGCSYALRNIRSLPCTNKTSIPVEILFYYESVPPSAAKKNLSERSDQRLYFPFQCLSMSTTENSKANHQCLQHPA